MAPASTCASYNTHAQRRVLESRLFASASCPGRRERELLHLLACCRQRHKGEIDRYAGTSFVATSVCSHICTRRERERDQGDRIAHFCCFLLLLVVTIDHRHERLQSRVHSRSRPPLTTRLLARIQSLDLLDKLFSLTHRRHTHRHRHTSSAMETTTLTHVEKS